MLVFLVYCRAMYSWSVMLVYVCLLVMRVRVLVLVV